LPEPRPVVVKVQEVTSWDLPEVDEGSLPGVTIQVEFDPTIKPFVTFDADTKKFSFNGEDERTY
jgi:hypothetical protein